MNIMRKALLIALTAMLFTSCGSMFKTTIYSVGLKNVESPKNSKEQFGETKIVNVEDNGQRKYQYEDDLIDIKWYVGSSKFYFDLKNKSNFSFKIPWDDITYVNAIGEVKRTMHIGVKYIDRNSSQPATTLPKNSTLSDILLPTDQVSFSSSTYSSGWSEGRLFPNYSTQVELDNSKIVGKSVRIVFPIIIENVTNEYIFEFNIESATIK